MKKRTAVFGVLVSLLPLGQPLVIGKGAFLTSAAVMLSIPEKAQAEEYACSSSKSSTTKTGTIKTERPSYKRVGTTFIETITLDGETDTSTHQIAKENNEFIVLIQTYDYKDAMLTMIDKKTKEFTANYIYWNPGEKPKVVNGYGNCTFKY